MGEQISPYGRPLSVSGETHGYIKPHSGRPKKDTAAEIAEASLDVDEKQAERRRKALKNAARHLALGTDLSDKAAKHRVVEGEPFENDAKARAERYAVKHDIVGMFDPESGPSSRLRKLGELAFAMVAAKDNPIPEILGLDTIPQPEESL